MWNSINFKRARTDMPTGPGDTAIHIQDLSKRYRIARAQHRHDTLRDALTAGLVHRVSRLRRVSPNGRRESLSGTEWIWALKDVSLEVKRGEVVGVIGRNGAGKSTLLKVLSRITEPTEGLAEIFGRMGTLLEVGTGFHPELTGRENIYLNGAICGMRKVEIDRKFDEIVAFAEVEKFIDTPVKRYSSGMYVRLAFAVAAHLEPEILMVDEVLSVGDAAFQKKCLGKLGEVAQEGRTVLFVSHNMAEIRNLCDKGVWLDEGRAMAYGPIDSVIAAYQQSLTQAAGHLLTDQEGRAKYRGFVSWRIVDSSPESELHTLRNQEPFTLEVLLRLAQPVYNGYLVLGLQSLEGRKLGGWKISGLVLKAGTFRILYRFPNLPLRPGVYYWHAWMYDAATRVDFAHLLPELVIATEDHSLLDDDWAGVINVPCDIKVQPIGEVAVPSARQ
jgi:lipopolysaccharide transport system ATP-binding protein